MQRISWKAASNLWKNGLTFSYVGHQSRRELSSLKAIVKPLSYRPASSSSTRSILFKAPASGQNGHVSKMFSSSNSSSAEDQVEKDFQAAIGNLQKITADVDNDKKLHLYGLYKQASNGPCTGDKPSMFNVVEKAKWGAWASLGDLPSEEAKKQYIAEVNAILEQSGVDAKQAAQEEPELVFEKRDGVYWIRLNRPKVFNALTRAMYMGITEALKRAAEDPDVKFAVITGNGKYFSSGNDLKNFVHAAAEFDGDTDKAAQSSRDLCQAFVSSLIDFPKPLIGVVNGPCIGIMFTTLALYDAVIASDTTTFYCPFSSLGQSPEGCSTLTFPAIFGTSLASELLYFNYTMPVEEAHRLGFVSRIIPADQLEEHVEKWLYDPKRGLVATCYPNSMINAKAIVRNDDLKLLMHEINKVECDALQQSWKSEECMEALQKFYTRRGKK